MPGFTITALSLCPGGNHVTATVTINSVSRTFKLLRSDLNLEPDDVDDAMIHRCRSAVKEAGASTLAQIQAALVNKPFQV